MQVTTSPEFGRWIKHSLSSYSLLYPHGFWLLLENILLFSWFLSSTPQKVQKRQSFINPHNTKSASIPSLHNKEFWSESYFHKTKCLAQIYLLKQQVNFYSVYNLGQAEISIFETTITTFPNGKRICLEPLTWVATISLTTESGKLG